MITDRNLARNHRFCRRTPRTSRLATASPLPGPVVTNAPSVQEPGRDALPLAASCVSETPLSRRHDWPVEPGCPSQSHAAYGLASALLPHSLILRVHAVAARPPSKGDAMKKATMSPKNGGASADGEQLARSLRALIRKCRDLLAQLRSRDIPDEGADERQSRPH